MKTTINEKSIIANRLQTILEKYSDIPALKIYPEIVHFELGKVLERVQAFEDELLNLTCQSHIEF
ncbi:MAG: hypothetical protein ACE5HR_00420 [bacterium]